MCSESCATAPLAILCRRFAVQPRDRVSRELQSLRISRCGGTDGSPTAARAPEGKASPRPRSDESLAQVSVLKTSEEIRTPDFTILSPIPLPAELKRVGFFTGRCLSEDSHSNLHLRKRVFASVSLAGARCRRSCKRYAFRGKNHVLGREPVC